MSTCESYNTQNPKFEKAEWDAPEKKRGKQCRDSILDPLLFNQLLLSDLPPLFSHSPPSVPYSDRPYPPPQPGSVPLPQTLPPPLLLSASYPSPCTVQHHFTACLAHPRPCSVQPHLALPCLALVFCFCFCFRFTFTFYWDYDFVLTQHRLTSVWLIGSNYSLLHSQAFWALRVSHHSQVNQSCFPFFALTLIFLVFNVLFMLERSYFNKGRTHNELGKLQWNVM